MRWRLHGTLVLSLLVGAGGAAAESAPLTVDDCVRLALARSPAARAAGFDVTAALARLRAARAAYAPRVSAQAEYGRAAGFDEAVTNGGSTAALLTVEATLLDGGLRDAQFAAASARLHSAKALERRRHADVAFAVRAAYLTTTGANAEVAIQQRTQRTLHDYADLLHRQEQLGAVPPNDALRAHLAADTASAAERAAAAERDAALSELMMLTGTDLTTELLIEPPAGSFVPADAATIEASPVLIEAQAALEAARRETDAVRSEWRGHVQLTASGGALGVSPDHTFQDNGGGQFLLGFALPLYDGGATAARVAAAAATADSAAAELRESRLTLVTALARVRIEARRAAADLTEWHGAMPRAAENFELMRARYLGGGNARLLEVLDALTQYVDTQLAVQHARLAGGLAIAKQQQLVGEVPP